MARVFTDAGAMSLATGSVRIFDFGAAPGAFAFWFYRTAAPAAERGILGWGDWNTDTGCWCNVTAAGLITAIIPGATSNKVRTSILATALNGWTHCVVNHSNAGLTSADFTFFINGVLDAGTAVTNLSGAQGHTAFPFVVGPGPGTTGAATTTAPPANIGPIAVWSRVLTPAEAIALAGGAHPLRFTEGLIDVWDMDGASVEIGLVGQTPLIPGTAPANTFANPAIERMTQFTRPRTRARNRYSVPAFISDDDFFPPTQMRDEGRVLVAA